MPGLREHGLSTTDIARKVEQELARIRPFIRAHAGDVEVTSVSEDGEVRVTFSGACACCPARGTTFAGAILPAVEAVPGVRSVKADGVNISAAALRRINLLRQTPTRRRSSGEP
jgi:Fe-S cluster biogenesis protein NfuA